mmetsp:Transcript_79161/g.198912  ORF Transcript_79161/g.198912 Transcript_79161/m.198912 type:complete len:257 (-) Transcript_79161:151-921(-)
MAGLRIQPLSKRGQICHSAEAGFDNAMVNRIDLGRVEIIARLFHGSHHQKVEDRARNLWQVIRHFTLKVLNEGDASIAVSSKTQQDGPSQQGDRIIMHMLWGLGADLQDSLDQVSDVAFFTGGFNKAAASNEVENQNKEFRQKWWHPHGLWQVCAPLLANSSKQCHHAGHHEFDLPLGSNPSKQLAKDMRSAGQRGHSAKLLLRAPRQPSGHRPRGRVRGVLEEEPQNLEAELYERLLLVTREVTAVGHAAVRSVA